MVKILLILVFVPVLLKTFVLLIKRFTLHCRIKKACKNVGTQFKSLSPWFKSIFWERGKADYLIGGKIKVSVLTLPYRNARYHFVPDEKKVDVVLGRRQMFLINRNVPKGVASITNVFKFASFNLFYEENNDGVKHVMLVYPVPREVTCVKGNKIEFVYNGDEISDGIVFNTRTYFFEHLLDYVGLT